MALSLPAIEMERSLVPVPTSQMTQSNDTAMKIEKNFLTCSVCFEVYTRPKCLPCLHTFCADCLLSYIESQDMFGIRGKMAFPCPMCKQEVHIRDNQRAYKLWLDELPNNFLIQNMIDCLKVDDAEETTLDNENEDEEDPVDETTPLEAEAEAGAVSGGPSRPASMSGETQFSFLARMLSTQNALNQPDAYSQLKRQQSEGFSGESSQINIFTADSQSHHNNTINDLIMTNPPMSYNRAVGMHRVYDMTARNWADYKPPMLSDVICLPKRNSIIVLDYDNRCIKYVKDFFLRRNVCTAMEVVGRPCCIALLDKDYEDRIVLSLLNRKKLYFIRVPDLQLIDVMDTPREYRGLTVLSSSTVLAASPGKPASVDLISIDHRCKMKSCQRISLNLYSPFNMSAISQRSFVISDHYRNTLFFYDIQSYGDSANVVRRFVLTPPQNSKFRSVGGICYKDRSVYFVDEENYEVYRVTLDGGVKCETILTSSDGIHKPASVCVGPSGEVVVVNWEGHVSLYKGHLS